jgi:hypothetical protein
MKTFKFYHTGSTEAITSVIAEDENEAIEKFSIMKKLEKHEFLKLYTVREAQKGEK